MTDFKVDCLQFPGETEEGHESYWVVPSFSQLIA
jgi:hypothetical protein